MYPPRRRLSRSLWMSQHNGRVHTSALFIDGMRVYGCLSHPLVFVGVVY